MKSISRLSLGFVLTFCAAASALADGPLVVPLWTNGAPGFENLRNVPETASNYWVRNINYPTITVFLPPADKANGAGVLICPGGGFRELVFNAEGVEPAKFFTNLGVAAFVLKYRLPRETNSPYSIKVAPRQDGVRAMRLVRSRATEWGLDTNRIGIIGFSAGGEVASLVSYGPYDGDASPSADDVDRCISRPDFEISIYPGPLGMPEVLPSNAPPVFFLGAGLDDWFHAKVIADLIPKYAKAKIPFEVHIYAHGGHGFNMGYRSKLASVHSWPDRLVDWMADNWILDPNKPAKGVK